VSSETPRCCRRGGALRSPYDRHTFTRRGFHLRLATDAGHSACTDFLSSPLFTYSLYMRARILCAAHPGHRAMRKRGARCLYSANLSKPFMAAGRSTTFRWRQQRGLELWFGLLTAVRAWRAACAILLRYGAALLFYNQWRRHFCRANKRTGMERTARSSPYNSTGIHDALTGCWLMCCVKTFRRTGGT
jgi:hypothetical protein